MQKKKIPNLLIISGLGRNIGKTEFATRIIDQQRQQSVVYSFKVSVIPPDPSSLVAHQTKSSYRIFEETDPVSGKDTSRMLRSGAQKVYYLQADTNGIKAAFEELLQLIPVDAPLVCESNSLGDFFSAGLHILLLGPEHDLNEFRHRITKVDHCIFSDRISGFPGLEQIHCINGEWHYQHGLSANHLQEEK